MVLVRMILWVECIEPNQSQDLYPIVQLIWLADKPTTSMELVVNVVNMCSKSHATILFQQ